MAQFPRHPGMLRMLVVTIPYAFYLVHAFLFGSWIIDDAAITFTYARNLAAGYGLVAQPGLPPVEGFSNVAWLAALLPSFLAGVFDPIVTPKLLSILFILGAFALAPSILSRMTRWYLWASALVLLLLATNTSFVAWSISGLENPLSVVLALTLLYGTIRLGEQERRRTALAPALGVVAALMALTRPDGLLYALVVPVFLLSESVFWSRPLREGAVAGIAYSISFLLVFGGYLIFRSLYFGDWLPNTYYAKVHPSPEGWWALGQLLKQLEDLFEGVAGRAAMALQLSLVIGTVALIALRRFTTAHLAALLVLACATVVYMALPEDWMTEYRFATVFFPALYLYTAGLIGSHLDTLHWRAQYKKAVFVGLALLVLLGSLRIYVGRTATMRSQPDAPFAVVSRDFGRTFDRYAEALQVEDASVLLPDVGGTLWNSSLRVYDLGGLTDRTVARTLRHDQPAFHDYIFDEVKPTFIHIHGAWTAAARFDEDPRFRRDYQPIHEYLDPWVRRVRDLSMYSGDFVRRETVAGQPDALADIK